MHWYERLFDLKLRFFCLLKCQQPNLKFKAYITSYFIFIGLIITMSSFSGAYLENTKFLSSYNSTIYRNYVQFIYRNIELKNGIIGTNNTIDSVVNCDISLRFMEPNPFQIAIFIWVIGFLWNELKQINNRGLFVYSKTPSKYKQTNFISTEKSFSSKVIMSIVQ